MADQGLSRAIAEIPFIDHHVHAPYKRSEQIDLMALRRPFTEASISSTWERHLPSLSGYRWMIRQLAGTLGGAPDERSVLEARNRRSSESGDYHRFLADAANLGACYADDLFALGECYDVGTWSDLLGGRPVHRVLRVEIFIEQCHEACPTLEEALERLAAEIRSAPSRDIVSLKSIAGYRTGLEIRLPDAAQRRQADLAYSRFRKERLAGEAVRIESKPLVDTIVWTALEAAAPGRLPMQFHVAFGDDDIIMRRNDPTLMRELFEHEPFREVPLVLLHCYPYHRKAGYLASIYPNAYVDLGLTIPIVGPGAERVLAEALELTPVSQLLASTDGHMIPEFQWFAIWVWRWAIERVLEQYVDLGIMDTGEAVEDARAILKTNAERIYPLPP